MRTQRGIDQRCLHLDFLRIHSRLDGGKHLCRTLGGAALPADDRGLADLCESAGLHDLRGCRGSLGIPGSGLGLAGTALSRHLYILRLRNGTRTTTGRRRCRSRIRRLTGTALGLCLRLLSSRNNHRLRGNFGLGGTGLDGRARLPGTGSVDHGGRRNFRRAIVPIRSLFDIRFFRHAVLLSSRVSTSTASIRADISLV